MSRRSVLTDRVKCPKWTYYGFAPTSKYRIPAWKWAEVVFCSAVGTVTAVAFILASASAANSAILKSSGIAVPSRVAIATPRSDFVQFFCLTACQCALENAPAISSAKSAPSGSNSRETTPIGIAGNFKRVRSVDEPLL